MGKLDDAADMARDVVGDDEDAAGASAFHWAKRGIIRDREAIGALLAVAAKEGKASGFLRKIREIMAELNEQDAPRPGDENKDMSYIPTAWYARRRRFRAIRIAEACERASAFADQSRTPDALQAFLEDLASAQFWFWSLRDAPGIDEQTLSLINVQLFELSRGMGADDLRAIASEWRRFAELPAQSDTGAP